MLKVIGAGDGKQSKTDTFSFRPQVSLLFEHMVSGTTCMHGPSSMEMPAGLPCSCSRLNEENLYVSAGTRLRADSGPPGPRVKQMTKLFLCVVCIHMILKLTFYSGTVDTAHPFEIPG